MRKLSTRFSALLGLTLVLSGAGLSSAQAAVETINTQYAPEYRDPYSRKFGFTVGIGFPTGLGLDLTYRPIPKFSFSGSVTGFPIPTGDSRINRDVSAGVLGFDVKGRWHPFDRSFFLGVGVGTQSLTVADSFNGATITRWGLTPHLGWMWIMDSGFTVGTELGVQLALSTSASENGREVRLHPSDEDAISLPLPYIQLIKLGYTF